MEPMTEDQYGSTQCYQDSYQVNISSAAGREMMFRHRQAALERSECLAGPKIVVRSSGR